MDEQELDQERFILVMQIVNGLEEAYINFENAYRSGDKRKFEISKKALLDFQAKLNKVLNKGEL